MLRFVTLRIRRRGPPARAGPRRSTPAVVASRDPRRSRVVGRRRGAAGAPAPARRRSALGRSPRRCRTSPRPPTRRSHGAGARSGGCSGNERVRSTRRVDRRRRQTRPTSERLRRRRGRGAALGGRPLPHRGHGEGGHHGRPSDRGLDPAAAPHRERPTEATTRSRSTSGERASTRRASSPRWSTTPDSSPARRWTTGYATWIPGISATSSATTCSAPRDRPTRRRARGAAGDAPYVRRAAFALVAAQAVHDRDRADAYFTAWLPRIRRAATDERTVVDEGGELVAAPDRQAQRQPCTPPPSRRPPDCSRSRAGARVGSRATRCASFAATRWSSDWASTHARPTARAPPPGRAHGRRACRRRRRHHARTARTRGRPRRRGARARAPRSRRRRPTPRSHRPAGRSRRRPARRGPKPSRSRLPA